MSVGVLAARASADVDESPGAPLDVDTPVLLHESLDSSLVDDARPSTMPRHIVRFEVDHASSDASSRHRRASTDSRVSGMCWEDDLSFLRYFLRQTFFWGFASFPCMPVFYALGVSSLFNSIYVGYIAHCFVGIIGQLRLVRTLEDWARRHETKSDDDVWSHYKAFAAEMRGPCLLCESCRCYLCTPTWVVYVIFYASGFITADMYAAAAGQAWNTWDDLSETRFEASWRDYPLFGRVFGCMSLPGVLTTLAFGGWFINILQFLRRAWWVWYYRLPYWSDASPVDSDHIHDVVSIQARFRFWQWCTHVADAGNLALVAEVTFQLQCLEAQLFKSLPEDAREHTVTFPSHSVVRGFLGRARRSTVEEIGHARMRAAESRHSFGHTKRKPFAYPNRGARFLGRVMLEACPNLWFQVSQLSVAYSELSDVKGRGLLIASIVVASYGIIGGIPDQANLIFHHCRRKRRVNSARKSANLILVLFIFILSVVRLVGVWTCSSRIWSFRGCMSVEDVANVVATA